MTDKDQSMTKRTMPEATARGMVPTLNNKGFMSTSLDPVSAAFVIFAGQSEGLCLDLGCAYGIATLAALENGAHVVACDMALGHVQVLRDKAAPEQHPRLRTVVGEMPQIDFTPGSFTAILCSRALHFLTGPDVQDTVQKMAAWLAPNGKVFLIADTPYTGFWAAGAEDYERRKAAGEVWPGFIPDVTVFLPEEARSKDNMRHLNPMDPDVLARVCRDAGLTVEHADFSGRPGQPNARTHAGVIASKAARR